MTKNANKDIVMKEVAIALGEDDLKSITRIFARLSSDRIETMIYNKVSEVFDNADKTQQAMASSFCEQTAKLRQINQTLTIQKANGRFKGKILPFRRRK